MKKNLWLIALAFLLASCSNLLNQNSSSSSSESKSNDGNTYLVVDKAAFQRAASSAREAATNLSPTQEDLKVENLKNIKITVKLASGENKTLLEVDAYENLADYKIPVEEGTWDYTLSAMLKDVPYSGTTRKEIKKGLVNTISFKLSSDIHYGKLNFTVSWKEAEEKSNANKIVATLKDAEQTKVIASKTIEASDISDKTAAIIFDKTSDNKELPGGIYYLSLVFYNEYTDKPLNTTEYYVSIAGGVTTKASLKVNLKETYNVIYHDNDGQLKAGAVKVLKFSMLSDEITLPEMTREGYFWGGWYDNAGFSGSPITKITPSAVATGDYNVYANWISTTLYVSGNGDDDADGSSESTAFQTINKACEKIIAAGKPGMDWKIYIIGDVTGPSNSKKKADARHSGTTYGNDFARSEIPSSVTSAHAKSILLTGIHTEKDSDGNPTDMINRGYIVDVSGPSDTGNVLAIATSVPVTIKNLLITRGDTSSTNPNSNSDPYYVSGGGLYIVEGANVTLDDGVLITRNKAKYGGAVYNAGTLTMTGSATIGNANATSFATEYVTATTNPCSNQYSQGGGIYNTGTVYLGTEEKSLTGGIYYSYGLTAKGGGIYNTQSGTVEMRSGTIGYNDGQSQGGGVYIESGTFTMLGGTIKGNSTGGNGGGVYVDSNAVFKFCGGTICGNNANDGGGGVYISYSDSACGKMFMYDDESASSKAVIGNASADSMPASWTNGANQAVTGAGIHVLGELYMGYISETETAPFTGGIYYNYNKGSATTGSGGGIYISGDHARAFINSGTIKNNYAPKGCAIYLNNNKLTLGGTISIPGGTGERKQDIYIYGYTMNIADNLSNVTTSNPIYITPRANNENSAYYTNPEVIKIATDASISSLETVVPKIKVTPLVETATGKTSYWEIDASTGKVIKTTSAGISASFDIDVSDDIVVKKNSEVFASGQILENVDGSITLTLDSVAGEAADGNNWIYCTWIFDGRYLEQPQEDPKHPGSGIITNPGYCPAGVSFTSNDSDNSIKITCTSSSSEPTIAPGVHDIVLSVEYEDSYYLFTLQIKQ